MFVFGDRIECEIRHLVLVHFGVPIKELGRGRGIGQARTIAEIH
jgi:hypothetical protein